MLALAAALLLGACGSAPPARVETSAWPVVLIGVGIALFVTPERIKKK